MNAANSEAAVIVGKAKFTTGSNKITINSYPFIPITNKNIIYYKINEITENDKLQLQESIINYIEIEENKKLEILKNKNNKWNYFNDLLYPYKNNKNKDIIKTEKCIDLLSFNYSNSIIYINDNINLSERLVCIQKNNITNYLEEKSILILYNLLKKYYLNLKLINDLSTQYNTDELIKKKSDIFELYIKYKK